MNFYRLDDDRIAVPCSADEAFNDDNRLERTELTNGIVISTVFLYVDHCYGDDIPVLFETMVFGVDEGEEYRERYAFFDDAIEGHWKLVNKYGGEIKIAYDKPLPLPEELFEI